MSRVLESFEVMLDIYRQKCIAQSAEIERLKEAMEDTLIASVRAPATGMAAKKSARPTAPSPGPSGRSGRSGTQRTAKVSDSRPSPSASTQFDSRTYLDEIAEELESVLVKNEQLEREVARLHQRLDVEESWREVAMEFIEMDARIHAMMGVEKGRKGGSMSMARYRETLKDALAKTRRLEKTLRAAV